MMTEDDQIFFVMSCDGWQNVYQISNVLLFIYRGSIYRGKEEMDLKNNSTTMKINIQNKIIFLEPYAKNRCCTLNTNRVMAQNVRAKLCEQTIIGVCYPFSHPHCTVSKKIRWVRDIAQPFLAPLITVSKKIRWVRDTAQPKFCGTALPEGL